MKRIIAILLGGILILQTACIKDGIDEEKLLSDEMKNQNPYQVNDNLHYISDSAQEYHLIVRSRVNEYHEFQNGNYAKNYLIELEKTSIVSIDTSQDFYFRLEMSTYMGYELAIRFYPPNKSGMTVHFDLPLSKNIPEYTDSVFINDKWYYDIFIEEIEKKDNDAYRLFYSTELGVIKVDFSDNSFLELEKIE